MSKILYITTLYDVQNSSASIRNNSLVKGLQLLGNEIDVYTVRWPVDMVSTFLKNEKNGNVYYTNLPNMSINNTLKHIVKKRCNFFLAIKRILKNIIFFPDVCSQWKTLIQIHNINGYDILITSSDFKSSHIVGAKIKKQVPNLKWIQIWGDPWYRDMTTPFYLKLIVKRKEHNLIKTCDDVIYVSEPTTMEMKRLYPKLSNKMHFIPRSYYHIVNKNNQLYNNEIHITYTGALGLGRNISNLIESVEAYNRSNTIKLVIDIYSNITDDLLRYKNYDCVKLHGVVDFEEMKNVYEASNILLFISNDNSTTQIPGKLFDYMGTNLPILCLVNNKEDAIYKFLKQQNQCIIIDNNKEVIINSMELLISSINKKYTINTQYSPKSIAKELISLF